MSRQYGDRDRWQATQEAMIEEMVRFWEVMTPYLDEASRDVS